MLTDKNKSTSIQLCALSAFLCSLAFHFPALGFLIWAALIPFFIALDRKGFRESFQLGFVFGFLFFAATLYWFFYLVSWFSFLAVIGVTLLFMYLALYCAVFGLYYRFVFAKNTPAKLILLPGAWVTLEFFRAHFLTGFDWVTLGYSQYKQLPLIQIADVTGVLGISFLIVMVNVALKDCWQIRQRKTFTALLAVLTVLVMCLLYGQTRLKTLKGERTLKAAVIQANISQDDKWNAYKLAYNTQKHIDLTNRALLQEPDLVIWPETSHSAILGDDELEMEVLQSYIYTTQVPFLIGMVSYEGENRYFNSAVLFSKNGELAGRYDKYHLVPFGEYLPWRGFIPDIIENMIPISDFSAGTELKVFSIEDKKDLLFNVLICFEDAVARLSRKYAAQGSGLFINMTNDAWFKDSLAPYLHLQASVLRAVENRRSVIRSANTGISAFIGLTGEILDTVSDVEGKKVEVKGYKVHSVPFSDIRSIYTRWGDVFAWLCLLMTGGSFLNAIFFQRKNIVL